MQKIDVENLKFSGEGFVAGLDAVKDEINLNGGDLVADWRYLDVMQCVSNNNYVDIVFRILDQSGREISKIEKVFKTMTSISSACIAADAFRDLIKKSVDDFADAI